MTSIAATYAYRLEVDWSRSRSWVDESANLVSASGRQQIGVPEAGFTMSRPSVDQATFVLDGSQGRYHLWNGTITQLEDSTVYGAPVRFEVSKDGDWYRLFTGRVKTARLSPNTASSAYTLTLECRTIDDAALQNKRSTTQANFASLATTSKLEGELIANLLVLMGFVDGTHFRSAAWVDVNGGTVTVERGQFVVPWFWLDDESLLEEIWSLAGACGGTFFVAADGLFTYRDMTWWARNPTSSRLTEYTDAIPQWDDRELFSGVVLEMNPRAEAGWQSVWDADAPLVIPPSGALSITARFSSPVLDYYVSDYRAVSYGGLDMSASVSLTVTAFAQRATLNFTNADTGYAAVVRRLSIFGKPATGQRSEERTFTSTASFWSNRAPRSKSVRSNLYIQTDAHANSAGLYLRDRLQLPRLHWRVGGAARPDLRLGDRVYIYDMTLGMSGSADEAHGYITGRTWNASQAGYSETLEYADDKGMFAYAATTPNYFIIGTDTLGAASTSPGRAFY